MLFTEVKALLQLVGLLHCVTFHNQWNGMGLPGSLTLSPLSYYNLDMKPENLLFKNRNNDADLVICDFGIAKAGNDDSTLDTICGSPGYVGKQENRQGKTSVMLAYLISFFSPRSLATKTIWCTS
jgi:serine/threonine protein kinase